MYKCTHKYKQIPTVPEKTFSTIFILFIAPYIRANVKHKRTFNIGVWFSIPNITLKVRLLQSDFTHSLHQLPYYR